MSEDVMAGDAMQMLRTQLEAGWFALGVQGAGSPAEKFSRVGMTVHAAAQAAVASDGLAAVASALEAARRPGVDGLDGAWNSLLEQVAAQLAPPAPVTPAPTARPAAASVPEEIAATEPPATAVLPAVAQAPASVPGPASVPAPAARTSEIRKVPLIIGCLALAGVLGFAGVLKAHHGQFPGLDSADSTYSPTYTPTPEPTFYDSETSSPTPYEPTESPSAYDSSSYDPAYSDGAEGDLNVDYSGLETYQDPQPIIDYVETYFGAVNNHDWDMASTVFAPGGVMDPADPAKQEQFETGTATTNDSDIQVRGASGTNEGADVMLAFTSTQDAADGPDGETCTNWSLTHHLLWSDDGRLLLSSVSDVTHSAC